MPRRRKPSQPLTDWRSITDEREKYQAYLCSREWAEKRAEVRERADDKCERCGVLPMSACHHLTYARKYNENLDDLQAICQPCHDFTHGKDWFDPTQWSRILRWLIACKRGKPPMPFELFSQLRDASDLTFPANEIFSSARILMAVGLQYPAEILLSALPFEVSPLWFILGWQHMPPQHIDRCYSVTGWGSMPDTDWWIAKETEQE